MTVSSGQVVRVAVTGGGALLGQGILRALRQSTLRTVTTVVDVSPLAAGLYWGDEAFLVPPASSDAYLDALRALLARSRTDILLIGTDVELAPLACVRAEFEREFGTYILVSSPDVIAIADDKFATAAFFGAHGFAAPASALAADRDGIERIVAEHGFPLIVKPRVGARSYGVSLVHSRAALDDALAQLRDGLVQECIGSDDGEYTASGLYFDGRCDAAIVMRRDLRDGNTYRAYVVSDATLDGWVRRWTEALRPHGPANFQFRIDPDGVPRVFEINGRFSGTTPLRALAGFNEVEMCIRHLLWQEPIMQPEVRRITVLRHWSETVVTQEQVDALRPA